MDFGGGSGGGNDGDERRGHQVTVTGLHHQLATAFNTGKMQQI